jgi:hypothetical protein
MRKVTYEDIRVLKRSSYIIKVVSLRQITWAGYVIFRVEVIYTYKILVNRPEHNKPLCRHRHRMIILKWNSNEQCENVTELNRLTTKVSGELL